MSNRKLPEPPLEAPPPPFDDPPKPKFKNLWIIKCRDFNLNIFQTILSLTVCFDCPLFPRCPERVRPELVCCSFRPLSAPLQLQNSQRSPAPRPPEFDVPLDWWTVVFRWAPQCLRNRRSHHRRPPDDVDWGGAVHEHGGWWWSIEGGKWGSMVFGRMFGFVIDVMRKICTTCVCSSDTQPGWYRHRVDTQHTDRERERERVVKRKWEDNCYERINNCFWKISKWLILGLCLVGV